MLRAHRTIISNGTRIITRLTPRRIDVPGEPKLTVPSRVGDMIRLNSTFRADGTIPRRAIAGA